MPARSVEFQRLAAEQLLIGGHIDRGLKVIRTVLQGVRLRFAWGPRTARASFLWRRMCLGGAGLTFVEQEVDRVPAAELLRVDTCWSVATGLVWSIRPCRGFSDAAPAPRSRHRRSVPDRLRLAVDAASISPATARPRRREAIQCAARAEAMAERAGHPQALACVHTRPRCFRIPGRRLAGGSGELRSRDQHAAGSVRWQDLGAQHRSRVSPGRPVVSGQTARERSGGAALLATAKGRGNLYFETELRTRMNLVWLVADEPDEGEQQANEALQQWSNVGFQRMHYNNMVARIQTELYRGCARAAWQAIAENWTSLNARTSSASSSSASRRAICARAARCSWQPRR